MVKRKKHDKDKYYTMAKQQGYRARSAFKLIQLNKKYDFLSSAKVCIDLCAAPGGWCQVAAKYMPVSSIIIGIDLLPIRPIRNVKTFTCDITTQKCRQIIKQELQTWSADVVLHDGAPNVGAEYSKDAFVQNELALTACKLAVDVMGPGGIFVTKVFRSQDYNALLWVFKQLFRKVSATKPLSSRNESAEIFVVCEKYLAPSSVDPKLFDPKFVFSQLETPESGITIFHPKFGVRKRHREGYDESLGMTLTNSVSVSEFVGCEDPIRLLTDTTSIVLDLPTDDLFDQHAMTTLEIRECIRDLKVLGKGDFKRLLKWRSALMDAKAEADKALLPEEPQMVEEPVEEKSAEQIEEERESTIREELAMARNRLASKKKREKKKEREQKAKLRIRAAMGMDMLGAEITQEQVFKLDDLSMSKTKVDAIMNAGIQESDDSQDNFSDSSESDDDNSDEEEENKYNAMVEAQMDSLYSEYLAKMDPSKMNKRATKRTKVAKRALAGEGLVQDAELLDGDSKAYRDLLNAAENSDMSDEDSDSDPEDSLIVKPKMIEKSSAVAARWFSGNDLFSQVEENADAAAVPTVNDDTDSEKEEEALPEMPRTDKQIRKDKRKSLKDRKERRETKRLANEDEEIINTKKPIEIVAAEDDMVVPEEATEATIAELTKNRDLIKAGMGALSKDETEGFTVVADEAEVGDDREYGSDFEDYDADDHAKSMALGTMMLRESTKRDMMDASYNRYAWNDPTELPDWFMDDEEKNYRPQIPIPKKLLDEMRDKFMSMATKPMKKVTEARMRKKKLLMKKMKVAKKKATDIANMPDMSTREKLKSIDKAMKGTEVKKQSKVYVVSTRGGKKNSHGHKKGDKGAVKFVDKRMKSDKRGADIKEKRKKKTKKRK